jgi:transcriptional regulator with XRE-family HTH domain
MAQDARKPSEVLRSRLREVRRRREWSQEDLAERLKELGVPMDRAVLARIEGGTRGVSLDEGFILAAALGVDPSTLFFPVARNEWVELAPRVLRTAEQARMWIRGMGPVLDGDDRFYLSEAADEDWARRSVGALAAIFDLVRELVSAVDDKDEARAADRLQELGAQAAGYERILRRATEGEN